MSKREMIQDEVAVGVSGGKMKIEDIEKMLLYSSEKFKATFNQSVAQFSKALVGAAEMKGQIMSTGEPNDVNAGNEAGKPDVVGAAIL